jgi:hypothetical protein
VTVSARDGKGRFLRTLEGAERDAEACRMRTTGYGYREIAEWLNYGNAANARRAVERVLAETVAGPAEDLRTLELERLDRELERLDVLEQRVWVVLNANHVTVSNGRIMYLGDTPLADNAPVLNAVDRLVKITESRTRISESRRKLLGLDAPAKVQSEGTVRYSIDGVNPEDLK